MKLGVFGYGGHAREVSVQIGTDITFFVDDKFAKDGVLGLSNFDPNLYSMMVAVADCKERENIVKRLPKETKFFTFIHPSAMVLGTDIEIGFGSFIGAYSIITTNIKIGNHAILNRGNQIGHDSIIGDYFSAMPGAIVSGNVVLGDRCYIGSNSSIKEKIQICSDVTIGSNGTVVKNISEKGTYVGVPAKKIIL
jgi:sugar O-acyltransferase (sialic acid O-acetyltransferase NeuD family)